MDEIKQHVRFSADFKQEIAVEYPGRDLAEFIAEKFKQRNYVVSAIEYEEEELYFTVIVVSNSKEFSIQVSHSCFRDDYWEIYCPEPEDQCQDKTKQLEILNSLDEILHEEAVFLDVKWYNDYEKLTDDYVEEPGEKRLLRIGKYYEKYGFPTAIVGFTLGAIGGITNGQESKLLVIGTILFVGTIMLFFVLLGLNIAVAIYYSVKKSFRNKTKKPWIMWLIGVAIIASFVLPVIMGLVDIPLIDRFMDSAQKYMFTAIALLIYGAMMFGIVLGVISAVKKKEGFTRIVVTFGLFLCFVGLTGFFGGACSGLGVLNWIPKSVEFPLAQIGDMAVNRDGEFFVISNFFTRIQMYDKDGNYLRGWAFNAHSHTCDLKINDSNQIEIAAFSSDKVFIYDRNGELLKINEYEDMYSWYPQQEDIKEIYCKATDTKYKAQGLVFPCVIQTGPNGECKIGKNAFYLFPFQGAFHGWIIFFIGMIILGAAEKKRKKGSKSKS